MSCSRSSGSNFSTNAWHAVSMTIWITSKQSKMCRSLSVSISCLAPFSRPTLRERNINVWTFLTLSAKRSWVLCLPSMSSCRSCENVTCASDDKRGWNCALKIEEVGSDLELPARGFRDLDPSRAAMGQSAWGPWRFAHFGSLVCLQGLSRQSKRHAWIDVLIH